MDFAIYARRSTDAQSDYSTADQIRECQSRISIWGGQIFGVYVDDAVSGSDISRQEYCRLKADAQAGRFDCVVIDDLSRMGRDFPEFVTFVRDIADIGITMRSVADGLDTANPSSKIPIYLKGIFNELFLDDLKAKIVRGLKGQVLRGYSTGGRIFGYATEPIYDPSGAKDKFGRPRRFGCRVMVDPDQADLVRRIFSMRESGLGYRSIAHVLNSERIPSPHAGCGTRPGFWCTGTIRGILGNRKYIGIWEYNRTRWIKKRVSGKRKVLKNDPSEWVTYTSEELRIISDSQFDFVSEMRRTQRTRSNSGRKAYLLSGLAKCGECGSSMIVENSGRSSCLVCNNARNKGPVACTNNHRISRFVVEAAILSELRAAVLSPKAVCSLVSFSTPILEGLISQPVDSISQLRRQKATLETSIGRLLDSIESQGKSESVKTRLAERELELRDVSTRLARSGLTPVATPVITPDWVEERLTSLSGLLEAYGDRVPLIRNELMKLIPDKLSLSPKKTDNGMEYQVTGKLNPFNLLERSSLQLCIIAAQGLEPRTRGL